MSNNKWIKLDGKKDPPFGLELIAWFISEDKKTEYWMPCVLDKIEQTTSGKKYILFSEGQVVENATHYMIPSSPNEVKSPKEVKGVKLNDPPMPHENMK